MPPRRRAGGNINIMTHSDISFYITLGSVIFGFGGTVMYLKEAVKSLKEDLRKLTSKVEAHNNFGLKIARLETRIEMLEKNR